MIESGSTAPVVILTYAYSGVADLQPMLAEHPELECTSGTGVLPLCDAAARTWVRVEGHGSGPLSSLAEKSIRAMASAQVTVIISRTGKGRWCEVSMARADRAEIFLRLFPGSRFILLHRPCTDAVQTALQGGQLSSEVFDPFFAVYPGNHVAGLALHWADRTEALLNFEEAHAERCLRIRYDQLVSAPRRVIREILAFLDLDGNYDSGQSLLTVATATVSAGRQSASGTQLFSLDQVPELKRRINELLRRLSYSPIGA